MKVLSLVLVALCAGCASSRVSNDVLELARSTRPAGAFHIEFGDNGNMIEAGAERTLESVPAKFRDAAEAAFPGGRQVGAARALTTDGPIWLIAKEIDGRSLEILVGDDGVVRGGEEVLDESAWPAHVVAAAKAAVPGAKLERVERVWGAEAQGAEAYHVKFNASGDSLRVGLTNDGQVVRLVRRIGGQVRVPR
jgi:hypothetical protein